MDLIRCSAAGAEVVFTTRHGGHSVGVYSSLNLGLYGGDEPRAVAANMEAVKRSTGIDRFVWSRQVHGTEVREVSEPDDNLLTGGRDAESDPAADGMITSQTNLGLMVLVADCLPVVIASTRSLAVLHCGWRGLAGGLIQRAISHLNQNTAINDRPENYEAVIGPGISAGHFQVGPELPAAFGQLGQRHEHGGYLDLKAIARDQLTAAGVSTVTDVARCTYAEPDCFYSYRRDGAKTGRQAAVAWLRPSAGPA